MRSNSPMWGNPWPHDMVITVEDRPLTLATLLCVRHAWAIVADADVPELMPPLTAGRCQAMQPAQPLNPFVHPWWTTEPFMWRQKTGRLQTAVG